MATDVRQYPTVRQQLAERAGMRPAHPETVADDRGGRIDPAVEAFIGRVIVPALVERWLSLQPPGAAMWVRSMPPSKRAVRRREARRQLPTRSVAGLNDQKEKNNDRTPA